MGNCSRADTNGSKQGPWGTNGIQFVVMTLLSKHEVPHKLEIHGKEGIIVDLYDKKLASRLWDKETTFFNEFIAKGVIRSDPASRRRNGGEEFYCPEGMKIKKRMVEI